VDPISFRFECRRIKKMVESKGKLPSLLSKVDGFHNPSPLTSLNRGTSSSNSSSSFLKTNVAGREARAKSSFVRGGNQQQQQQRNGVRAPFLNSKKGKGAWAQKSNHSGLQKSNHSGLQKSNPSPELQKRNELLAQRRNELLAQKRNELLAQKRKESEARSQKRKLLSYEAVTNQFTHRLIKNGKASKARSIFEKATLLLSQGSSYRDFLGLKGTTPILSPWLSATVVAAMNSPQRRRCRWSRKGVEGKVVKPTRETGASLVLAAGKPEKLKRLGEKVPLASATSSSLKVESNKKSKGDRKEHQPSVFAAVAFALEKVKPVVEPKMVKRAGRSICVPSEITACRQLSVAIRWTIESARKRSGSSMVESLAQEWEDILSGNLECGSLKKRDQWHRLVQANRANTNVKRS
jgi:ribosomal protein S7